MAPRARPHGWLVPLVVGGALAGAAALAFSSPAHAAVPPAAPAVSLALHPSGLSLTATASATGTVTSWAWSWGDGATSAGAPPQTHTYATGGSYTVTVTATGPGGSGSAQGTATVAPPETAPTVAVGSPQVNGLTVTLSATATATTAGATITSEAWTWGDGTTSTGASPQSHTYATAGTYTVSVAVADSDGLSAAASTPVAVVAPSPHVFLLIMENKTASQVAADSYVQSLMAQYGTATNYSGVTNPSLPNYLAITSGQWASDLGSGGAQQPLDDPLNAPFAVPNLFDQLETAGISWGAYAGGFPASGLPAGWTYPTLSSNGYGFAGHHFPSLYYTDVADSPAMLSHLQPWTALQSLLAGPASGVPQFCWVTPWLSDQGSIEGMKAYVQAITASAAWKAGGVLIVTWDNQPLNYGGFPPLSGFQQAPNTDSGGGNVLTLVISRDVTPGTRYTQVLSHYSTLAAIETAFGLPLLGYAATAPAWPELVSLIEEPVAAAEATVSDAQWSLPGVSPSVSSRGITAAAAGTGQLGFAWYRGGFALTAAPGSRFSSVTLSARDVGGTFSWDGQAAGSYAQGTAVWVLSPAATPDIWTAFGLGG